MKLFNICFRKNFQFLCSFSHMHMHHAWNFTNIFRFLHIFFEHNLMKKCCAYVQIKKYFSKIAFLSKNYNFSKDMNLIKQNSSIKILFSKFRYLNFSLLKIDFLFTFLFMKKIDFEHLKYLFFDRTFYEISFFFRLNFVEFFIWKF